MFGKKDIDSGADEREQEERKILRRISKLLQKAESTGHEPEREAFEAKARELMEKHSISRGELDRSDFVRLLLESRYKATPGWQKQIIFKTTRYLGCYALHTRTGHGHQNEWKIFGHKRDVTLARYMVGSIEAQIEQMVGRWKARRRTRRAEKKERVSALEEKLSAARREMEQAEDSGLTQDLYEETFEIRRLIKQLKSEIAALQTGRKSTNGYRVGLAKGVTERLWKMAEEVSGGEAEKALVPTEERDQKYERAKEMYDGNVADSFGGPSSSDMMATREGYQDSEEIKVHKSAPEPGEDETAALPEG